MSIFNNSSFCSILKESPQDHFQTVFQVTIFFSLHELPYINLLNWSKGAIDASLRSIKIKIFLDIGVSTKHFLLPCLPLLQYTLLNSPLPLAKCNLTAIIQMSQVASLMCGKGVGGGWLGGDCRMWFGLRVVFAVGIELGINSLGCGYRYKCLAGSF